MKAILLLPLMMIVACTPADKQAEAASAYEAAQMKCVDDNATKPEIDRCRSLVKLNWSTDAGSEAGK